MRRRRSVRSPPQVVCLVLVCIIGVATMVRAILSLALSVEDRRPAVVKCSVRVNTFRRNDLLSQFVAHYGPCGCVAEIVVIWSDTEVDPPAWLARTKVRVERHPVDSLNNRFASVETPAAAAVFSVDDDVFVSCSDLQNMVRAWRASPRQMLGPAPRLVEVGAGGDYRYLRWWHVWWNARYSLVLTKVAIFHRDYLAAYHDPRNAVMKAVRDHVDRHRNCEDIAMSFLVANATKAPPVWFRAAYVDYGQSFASHAGISAGRDHLQIRQECLRAFAALFGHDPLQTATHKVLDASTSWFW